MKIRTQFFLAMILFGIMLMAISSSVILTSREVERLNEQVDTVHRIERGASDLGYLTNDYLLYRESQQRGRWETTFSSFSSDLSKLNPDSPEQQAIVDHIRENVKRWHAVFRDISETLTSAPQFRDASAVQTPLQVAWSRMAVQGQGIIFETVRLEALLRSRIDRLRQRNLVLIMTLLVIFGAYFLTNYILVHRRTLKSLSDLQAGTEIIGSGDLDFVIPAKRTDEVGDLAQAFNRMTVNLKGVTASKAELEKEMAQRRKAEEELRIQREWLEVTLRSIGDAVIATDTACRITFMNPVAAGLTGWDPAEALNREVRSVVHTINEKTGEEAEDIVRCVLTEGCILNMANHTALISREGKQIPIEDSAAPIRDADGTVIGVVLVFRDVTEKRRAQAALREAAERLRIVADFTHDWEYWRSPEDRFHYVSPSCENVSGYRRDEFIEDPGLLPRIIHPDDRERVLKHMREDVCENKACELEFRILHRDGRERWIGHVCQPVVDALGRPMGRRASNRDITDRKRAEQSLRESEHRYRNLFETMTEGFALHEILCDGEGLPCDYRFLDVNPAFERQTGLKADTLMGRTLLEVLPDAEPFWIERYGRVALTGKPDQFEHWSQPLERFYDVSVYQTEPGRFATVFLDVTERKRAERALRVSESRFRLLSETAGRLLATQDPQGIVEDLCREVMAHLDCQCFFNFMVDREARRLRLNAFAGIPETEAKAIEWLDMGVAVCGCVARDGERIVAENIGDVLDPRTELVQSYGIRTYACHPLIVQGRVLGTLSFGTRTRSRFLPEELALMKTVTDQVATAMDRMELIQELRRSRDELDTRVQERTAELEQRARQLSLLSSELTLAEERERRRLAAILHDGLQQFLVAAKMNLEILSDGLVKEKKQSVEGILDLVTQSIKASRSLTAELSPPVLQRGGLSAALKWLVRWMRETHGLDVDLSVDPLLDPKREDHALLLFRSVRELLFNVVKHAGVESARVDMCKDEDGRHRIIVSDQGTGLDPESIWENAGAGAGFGLFSIRERMMLMGGRFEVAGKPGMGTSFSLILPSEKTESVEVRISDTEGKVGSTVPGQPLPFTGEKIRVMLVDDHEVVRNGFSTLLGGNPDIEIVGELSDGEEAVRRVRKVLPNVILMDINMPNMNGVEATRRIHSEFPHIRIIVLSMYEDHDLASAALDAGATAFLSKSGSTEALLQAIRGEVR